MSAESDKGLTQEQLATMMQVDSITIYRWENGIVAPSLVKTAVLKDILIKAGDGRNHPFVDHLLTRSTATAILDFHGVYHKVNDAYLRHLGLAMSDLAGNRAWELLADLTKVINDQTPVDLDKFVQGKIACVRVENLLNEITAKKVDHELHVIAQKRLYHNYYPSIETVKSWQEMGGGNRRSEVLGEFPALRILSSTMLTNGR